MRRAANSWLGFAVAATLSLPAAPALAAGPMGGGITELVAGLLPQVVNITITGGAKREIGSGFVIDPSGVIMTNRHVTDGGNEYVVVMNNHTRLKATLLFRATGIDLALLQVHAGRPLTPIRWGDSNTMRPGDAVIAIGNPLGLGSTVTTGIVSALNRDIKETQVDEFIQIDAPLNPGNSGGPLFNAAGEVVGVNTALFTVDGSGGSIGLGFSIPGNDAKFVALQLLRHGIVRVGTIGIGGQDITPEMAEALGLPAPLGVVLAAVPANSMAAKAGLQVGDVVKRFGDLDVDYLRNLNHMIVTAPIGTAVSVGLLRGGREMVVPVTVGELPFTQERALIKQLPPPPPRIQRADMGLSGGTLNDEGRQKWKLAKDLRGLLVQAVLAGSTASDLGFVAGNVIQRIQDNDVDSIEDIVGALARARMAEKAYIMALVSDAKSTRWVAIPVRPAQ